MNPAPGSTLVFHTGALGDSVLIWPMLRALATRGPVTLIAARDKARLAQRYIPGVTAVDGDSPDFSRLFAAGAELEISESVRDLIGNAAQTISFVSNREDAFAENLKAIAPITLTGFIVPHQLPKPLHITTNHFLQLLVQHIAVAPVDPEPRPRTLDGPVLVHPGSGGRDKCWPADRFEKLLEHFRAIGRPTLLILGEVELERMPAAQMQRWRDRSETVTPADLQELAEHIARAALYIGNDSGPTHLAAQLGVPTLALFGPTDPRIWAPRGPAVTVLSPPEISPMNWLSTERVIEAAARW